MKLKYTPENIFLVGGSVRDFILHKPINDLDFVIRTSIDNFYKEANIFIKKNFNKKGFLIGKEFPPTVRTVLSNGQTVDITLMVNNFEEDALRRDFTVNALYFDLTNKNIIDPFGFKRDCDIKKLRNTTDKSFIDDPLRMLRAIRLLGDLNGFSIASSTYINIEKHKKKIGSVASERIREEIEKIFISKKRYILMKYLRNTGLLFEIFPELKLIENLGQKKKYHKFDVLGHSLNIFKYIDDKASDEEKIVYSYLALFHDIGKFHSSHKHTVVSSNIARNIFRRLKLPKKKAKLIVELIENHMKILHISLNQLGVDTLKRFVFEKEKIIYYLINFSIMESHTKTNQSQLLETVKNLKKIRKEFEDKKEFIFSSVTGRDMKILGVEESKVFGEILDEIRFEIFRDNLTDKNIIFKRLKSIVKQKKFS